jgi:hypothetical protein
MHRRCNYDSLLIDGVVHVLRNEHARRSFQFGKSQTVSNPKYEQIAKENALRQDASMYHKFIEHQKHFERSTVVSVAIVNYINDTTVALLSDHHLQKLSAALEDVNSRESFELVTIHDEFKASPNNMNHVRWTYNEILASIAESDLIDDLLSQIYGRSVVFDRDHTNQPLLARLIRACNYAIC